jgi:putative salt-induced outer membrane protein YdiY
VGLRRRCHCASGGARHEEDHFGGLGSQATLSAGLGHPLIDSIDTKLSGQVGVGYKRIGEATSGNSFVQNDLSLEVKMSDTLTTVNPV